MNLFSRAKTKRRRRDFLIDTNQSVRRPSRKFKSRFLSALFQLRFLRRFPELLRFSVLKIIVFVLMTGFVLFSTLSPYFDIRKISFVRDNPSLNIEKIEESLMDYYGKNLLFVSEADIEALLRKNFAEIRSISFDEKWPSELEITLTMSPPFVNIFNEETANFWVVSEDGVILQMTAKEELPTFNIRQYTKPIVVGERFLDAELLSSLFELRSFLVQEFEFEFEDVVLLLISREIHFITSSGMALWFDISQNLVSQAQKLKLAEEKIGLFRDSFDYIDLRIPDQIFYKKN